MIVGNANALISSHKTDLQPFFGIGKDKDTRHWMALIRQILVGKLLKKEIETYGVLRITEVGQKFMTSPTSFMMAEDHVFDETNDDSIITNSRSSGGVADEKLMTMLKDLRKSNAKRLGVQPFVIFQDPSLEDMALKYPINTE